MQIAPITESNYNQVAAIYQEGLDTGLASFETNAPSWEIWDGAHIDHSRIAAMKNDVMLGWAALSPTSSRCVYGGVGEVSVYVAAAARGKGVGRHKSSYKGLVAIGAPGIVLCTSYGFRSRDNRKHKPQQTLTKVQ